MKKYVIIFILTFLFIPIFMSGEEVIKIKGINTKEIKEGISIEITLDKPVTYRYFILENPPRLAVNLYDVVATSENISVDKAMVKSLRIAQFSKKPKLIARIVVDLTQIPEGVTVTKEENLIFVNLYTKVVSEVSSSEATTSSQAVSSETAKQGEEPVKQGAAVQSSTAETTSSAEVVPFEIKKEEKPVVIPLPAIKASETVSLGAPAVSPSSSEPLSVLKTPRSKEMISLDFRDAEISDVIWILAKKARINVIGREDIKGKVTIHLDSVDPKDALDIILRLYGYAYEKESENIFRIVKTEAKGKEGRIEKAEKVFMTKSFVIKYAKASQIAATVSKMLSLDGVMQADDPSNSIIVIDSPTNIESIGRMIGELDLTPKQVLIEVKFAEISSAKGEDFRTIWNRIGQSSGEVTGKIYLAPMGGTGFGITVSAEYLDALIELFKSATDFNLMSTPQIVTLDNREARIQVGSQVPYKKTTVVASGGTTTTSEEIIYLDVGVVLAVTPHISGANSVIVDIQPTISDYEYSKDVPGVPVFTTRNITSRVLINDGQTLIVGGLMKDDVRKSEYKVPLLGDIPLLGALFKYSSSTKLKVNLVIFITPHIIR